MRCEAECKFLTDFDLVAWLLVAELLSRCSPLFVTMVHLKNYRTVDWVPTLWYKLGAESTMRIRVVPKHPGLQFG